MAIGIINVDTTSIIVTYCIAGAASWAADTASPGIGGSWRRNRLLWPIAKGLLQDISAGLTVDGLYCFHKFLLIGGVVIVWISRGRCL